MFEMNRKSKKSQKRKLHFEPLDARRVLSVNTVTFEAPEDFAELFGSDAKIDVVDDRTTFRGLDVAGYDSAPDVAALSFLSDHGQSLGLPADVVESLEVIDTKYGIASGHAYLQQTYQGLPVAGAQITVSMNDSGSIQTVHTSFTEHTGSSQHRTVGLEASIELAERHAGVDETWMDGRAEAVWSVNKDGSLEPAWEMMVHASAPRLQDLLMVVSAVDGEVVFHEDRSAHATGTGDVFEPNPYQTQGSGANMVDNNDATSAALEAQMVSVTLERLDEGTGLLKGEWVDLTLPGGLNVPDANEPDRVYEYDRDDPRFEQVVVYYTVDQLQEYFHSLGFDDDAGTPNGIRDFPTMAHAHWFNDDQSFYSLGNDAIHFGDGGVDDGEDADIIAHEYGHAVQHDQNPNWGGGEMGAMGEGFGDYLAASFYADVGDTAFQNQHAAAVGEWDAVSYSNDSPPNLRRVDGNKMYPDDLSGQVHADGEIWSAALWDLRGELGGAATDQLVLESHFGLPGGSNMFTAFQSILQADMNLNGGANQAVITDTFEARGIMEIVDDHGNSAASATPFPLNTTQTGRLDQNGDVDYFSFTVPATAQVRIETMSSSGTDTTLTLFGTNGTSQLSFDDDGGAGFSSRIDWTAPSSGTFFVAVRGYNDIRTGPYSLEIESSLVPMSGDFDSDGDWDCADIDGLVSRIAGGTFDAAYDLDSNGVLDSNDVSEWLAEAGANNLSSGNAYLPGDADLDGFVDASDFNLWNQNKFTATAAWCSGDFTADGSVDASDFNVWNSNKFQGAAIVGDEIIAPVVTYAAGGLTDSAAGQVELPVEKEVGQESELTPVVTPFSSADQYLDRRSGSARALRPAVIDLAFLDDVSEDEDDQDERDFFAW